MSISSLCIGAYLLLLFSLFVVLALIGLGALVLRVLRRYFVRFTTISDRLPPAEYRVEFDPDDPDATGKRFIGTGPQS